MAFESLASRSSLPKPGCSQRRISYRLPDGPIAKLMVAFCSMSLASRRRCFARALSSADLTLATPPLTGRWVSATGEIAPSARSSLTYCAPPIAFQ